MDQLLELCAKTYSEQDMECLKRAIDFAKKAHQGQFRASGEPFYIHPQAVAMLLYEMGLDRDTVIAGLLHDVVEDAESVSLEQIASLFGKDVAGMVDGVTKLTQASFSDMVSVEDQRAENLRKMFLAIANDMRVVIIKLADRLHNMRTLEYCTEEKRMRKSKETLEVYAPLAHRFGMGAIKSELEDLSFAYLYPDEYEKLSAAIKPQQEARMELLQTAMDDIQKQLEAAGIEAEIGGRLKHLYSVYRKMVKQNSSIDEIYDLIAIRVIVNTVNDCYAALGVVHSIWKPVPGRFKDYIALPKTNLYRSLHTTLFGERGIPFEVQIRTPDMHRAAEYGIAAHWMYKEGRQDKNELDTRLTWLRQALEYENDADTTREFVENIRKDFFSDYVFVLTPRGEIIDLPLGSTPLDFAYRIHTNVGHRAQHAKVNGAMVKLDYKLKTNDVVEIVTSAQASPSRDWLNIVKTQQAKAKIRQWFKKANREENIQRGKEMLSDATRRQGHQLADLLQAEYVEDILKRLNMAEMDDVYAAIGYGGVTTGQVLHKLLEQKRKAEKAAAAARLLEQKEQDGAAKAASGSGRGIIVKGQPNMVVRFARCCTPLPGDAIIGYITRGRGVSVHRKDCPNIDELLLDPERIIDVEWASDVKSSYTASVQIIGNERPGILMEVSQVMLNMNINLTAVNAKSEHSGLVTIQMSFNIESISHLNTVIKNLKKIKGITEVYRLSA